MKTSSASIFIRHPFTTANSSKFDSGQYGKDCFGTRRFQRNYGNLLLTHLQPISCKAFQSQMLSSCKYNLHSEICNMITDIRISLTSRSFQLWIVRSLGGMSRQLFETLLWVITFFSSFIHPDDVVHQFWNYQNWLGTITYTLQDIQ